MLTMTTDPRRTDQIEASPSPSPSPEPGPQPAKGQGRKFRDWTCWHCGRKIGEYSTDSRGVQLQHCRKCGAHNRLEDGKETR